MNAQILELSKPPSLHEPQMRPMRRSMAHLIDHPMDRPARGSRSLPGMMMSTNRLIIPAVCRYTQDMDGSDSQPGNCDGRNEAVLDMCGAVQLSAGEKAEVVSYADN